MAGSVVDFAVVPPRLDDAMVKEILQRLNDLGLWAQVLAVTVFCVAILLYLKGPEQAFVDLWLTHDQQAMRLFEAKDLEGAAEKFEDPGWKALAQYRAGDYAEAAETWARVASAEGFYNRGNAYMKAFEYRKAIPAYELAVEEAPDWVEAQENLELARYTLDYIERSREQSDTGEESGIGADDIVYDNTSERGAETKVSRESAVEAQSAEKWMRTVDTDTADFLRSRFMLESARRGEL